MVDCVKFATILEYENLVRHVGCYFIRCDFNLGPLRAIRLGDMKDFAPLNTIAMVAAEPRFAFVRPDI